MSKKLETLSKTLSYFLRHRPEELGITLDSQGWTDIPELLSKLESKGTSLSISDLEEIVAKDSKTRYSIKDQKIRANQGHSTRSVSLTFKKETPPFTLFHGTSEANWNLIKKSGGLSRMNRHHVHLSFDEETAIKVGSRKKDKLVILQIEARKMMNDGFEFFLSDNGVWLTNEVPLKYIKT